MAALCRECHNDIDQGTGLDQIIKRGMVRHNAVGRLVALLEMDGVFAQNDFTDAEDELNAARAIIRYCDANGITHPSAGAPCPEAPR